MEKIRLCHIDDLPNDSAKSFELSDKAIFIVKKYDRVYAYENSCPHLGIQLEWLPDKFLDMDAELIQCSTHGALFIIESGECVAGPCSGQHLQPLDLQLEEGDVYISA